MANPLAGYEDLATSPGAVGDVVRDQMDNPAMPLETPSDTAARIYQGTQQKAKIQRIRAADFAARDVPAYQDDAGNTQPVTDESGAPLTNFDKAHGIAYDSTGNPKKIEYGATGAPSLKDPFEGIGPAIDPKTGEKYRIAPGLPWQYDGQDEKTVAENRAKEIGSALKERYSILGRQLTPDEHDLTKGGKESKHLFQDLSMATQGAVTPDHVEGGLPAVTKAINDHFDQQAQSSDAQPGMFGGFFGTSKDEAAARQKQLADSRAAALEKANNLFALKDKIEATRQRVEDAQAERAAIAGAQLQASDDRLRKATGLDTEAPSPVDVQKRQSALSAIAASQRGEKLYGVDGKGGVNLAAQGRPFDAATQAAADGLMPPVTPEQEHQLWSAQQFSEAKAGKKTYGADNDGNLQLSAKDPVGSLNEAMADGVIDPEKGKLLAAQLAPVAQRAAEFAKLEADNPTLSKALAAAHGVSEGATFFGGGSAAVSAATASGLNPAIGGAFPPVAEFTVPIAAGLEFLGGGAVASWLKHKAEKTLANYSESVKTLLDSTELHPNYDTAGNLAGIVVGAGVTSIPKLVKAGLVASEALGAGATTGQKIAAAATALSPTLGGGAAGGAAFEGVLRPTFDLAVQKAQDVMGIQHEQFQPPTAGSILENAAIGALLAGHGIGFKEYDAKAMADIFSRAGNAAGKGVPLEQALSQSEIEAFNHLNGKLGEMSPEQAQAVVNSPNFRITLKQAVLAPDRPIGDKAMQKYLTKQEAKWTPEERAVVESVRRYSGQNPEVPIDQAYKAAFEQTANDLGKTPDEISSIYSKATKQPTISVTAGEPTGGTFLGGEEGGDATPPTGPASPEAASPTSGTPTKRAKAKVVESAPQEGSQEVGPASGESIPEKPAEATPLDQLQTAGQPPPAPGGSDAAAPATFSPTGQEQGVIPTDENTQAHEQPGGAPDAQAAVRESGSPHGAPAGGEVSGGEVDTAAHEAATSPLNERPEPTIAQTEAGNYKKGHIKIAGIDISVENPAGSERKGITKGGKPWSVQMQSHYGYIKGTVGRDKDHVDVFVKPGTPENWSGTVFVMNQVDQQSKRFDEHKVVLGAKDKTEATALYLANYDKGWKPGSVGTLTVDQFKEWLKTGDQRKPLEGVKPSPTKALPTPSKPAATPSEPTPAKITPQQALDTARAIEERLKIGIKYENVSNESGIQMTAGVIKIQPNKAARSMQEVAAEQKRLGIESTPEAFLEEAIREEIIHSAQDAIAQEQGKTIKAYYDAIPAEAFPDGWEEAGAKTRGDWQSMPEWKKRAEFVRMVLQGKWRGTITEALHRILNDVLKFLKLASEKGSDWLKAHVAEVGNRVEAMRKEESAPTEASDMPTPQGDSSKSPRRIRQTQHDHFRNDPIVSTLMEHGGLLSKSAAKSKLGAEGWDRNKGEWDDVEPMENPAHNVLYRSNGLQPDEATQILIDAGLLPANATPPDLWAALKKASKSAEYMRQQIGAQNREVKAAASDQGDFSLESPSDEQLKAEEKTQAQREAVRAGAAKHLTGSPGDLTSDMFGGGDTPLFNERRDKPAAPTTQAEYLEQLKDPAKVVELSRNKYGIPVLNADKYVQLSPAMKSASVEDGQAVQDGMKAAADKARQTAFDYLVARPPSGSKDVLFTMGGPGSGKSEFTKGEDDAEFVVDSVHGDTVVLGDRIQKVLDSGRMAEVVFVARDPADAMRGNLERALVEKRAASARGLVAAHVEARSALKAIAKRFAGDSGVRVRVVNSVTGDPFYDIPLSDLPDLDLDRETKRAQGIVDAIASGKDEEWTGGKLPDAVAALARGNSRSTSGDARSKDEPAERSAGGGEAPGSAPARSGVGRLDADAPDADYDQLSKERFTSLSKTPEVAPTDNESLDIRKAYEQTVVKKGLPAVPIADVLERAGYTKADMDHGRGIVMHMFRTGEIQSLPIGDWSISSPRERAWSVTKENSESVMNIGQGAKGLLMRMPHGNDIVRQMYGEQSDGGARTLDAGPVQKVIEAMTPGLEIGADAKKGFASLLLPGWVSPEHLRASEVLGSKLGAMNQRQESAVARTKASWLMFEKLGVQKEDLPIDKNAGIQFMSDASTGRAMPDMMKPYAALRDAEYAKRMEALEKAGVPLQTVRENYFPGVWTAESRKAFNLAMDEAREQGVIPQVTGVNDATAEQKAWVKDRVDKYLKDGKGSDKDALAYLTRTPFKGKESFRKQKVFDQDIATAFEFGLRATNNNPVDMDRLKWAEMDRNIMANQALQEWAKDGKLKIITPFEQVPEGWQKINDKYGTVYGSPTVGEKEYVDKNVYDGLMEAARRLGIEPERVFRAGRGRLGYASPTGETVSQFATELSVLAHEIGHQLDFKYDLWERIVRGAVGLGARGTPTKAASASKRATIGRELRSLADLSWEGNRPDEVSAHYKTQVRKKAEKMAHMLEAYIHAKEKFREVAPTVYDEFEKFLKAQPETAGLTEIKPGISLQQLDNERYVGLPIMGYRIVPNEVGDVLNNYLSSSLYNNRYFGHLYKAWMTIANLLNQAQLGFGSMFHAGFETSEGIVSSGAMLVKDVFGLMRGNRSFGDVGKSAVRILTSPISTPMAGDKVLNAWDHPDGVIDSRIAQVVRAAELAGGGFTNERGLQTDQYHRMVSDWYNGHTIRAAMRAPVAFLELMAAPLVKFFVPRVKAGIFSQLAWRIIEQNPDTPLEELRPQFRQAWNRTDARGGQVRNDRLFINNTAKNIIQGVVRAPGWSGGTIAELGGAFKDTYKFFEEWTKTGKLPQDVPDRVAYTISLLLTVGLTNALLTYLFTGEKPKDLDYWAFRTGAKDDLGHPERFMLPTYMKDIIAYRKEPVTTLLNKSHPLMSVLADIYRNKDYYGVEISHDDDNALKRQLQKGAYVAKSFTPFWIRGVQREQANDASLGRTLLPLAGVMPAPRKVTQTPAEEEAANFSEANRPAGARTQAQTDKSTALRKAVQEVRAAKPIPPEASRMLTIQDMQSVQKRAGLTPLQGKVKGLPLDQAERVYAKATPHEKAELGAIMAAKRANAQKKTDGAMFAGF